MPKCWRNWLDKCFEGKVLILTVHYDLFTTISFKLPFVIVISQGIVIGSWVQFFSDGRQGLQHFRLFGFCGLHRYTIFQGWLTWLLQALICFADIAWPFEWHKEKFQRERDAIYGPALSFWETTHKNDLDSIHLHDKHYFSQIFLEKIS